MDRKRIVCKRGEWFRLAQDRVHWRHLANTGMNLWNYTSGKYIE
jgi:hypothetical protein